MKMLFFSSDRAEVELVLREFVEAGIACELRDSGVPEESMTSPADVELWIQNDADFHRALMLCVQLRVGFAKRTTPTPLVESG
jgi:hypothetical protein